MTRSITIAILLALMTCDTSLARSIRVWAFDDLHEKADIVVVGVAVSSKDIEYTETFRPNYLVQQETVFEIQTVLKGGISHKKGLRLVHFRFKGALIPPNGPSLVHFRTGKNRPSYLLFLKLRKDGKVEAVTGQMDPILSVKVLAPPDQFPPGEK